MSLKAKIKQYGIINSFKRGVKSLSRRIGIQYESFYLMVNHIAPEELKQKMEQYDYSDVKELTYDDFKFGDPAIFTPYKMQIIKNRFDNGKYWAYGVKKDNRLIYSTWISKNNINFSSNYTYFIKLDNDQAVLEDSYCHHDYRGNGFHSKMNLYRLIQMIALGVNHAYAVVVVSNKPALKTQQKSGLKIIKQINFLKIWGKQYTFEKASQ